ncbi:hypothetical protein FOBRF1_006350 [Fusarium oxysporum]
MSSDHNLDQTTDSPSSASTSPQQSQQATLDLLPDEVLLQISGEPGKDQTTLSAREFKGLCLLSPSLSKLYLPLHYFSNNHSAFRDAIRDADVKVLERCVQLGAAPAAPDLSCMKWELPESDGCQCLSERPHTHHRPIDELLESVYLGKAPIDKCVDTLKWLLERECDMKEQGDQPCDHAPEFLITILSKSPDRTCTEGICQMINLLQSYSYSLPFTMNMDTYWQGEIRDSLFPGLIRKPMEGAAHGVNQPWWKFTNLLDTIWGLFLDLTDRSTSWAEQYRGKAADILEQKLGILIEYNVLNRVERKMLRRIVEAMRSLTTPIKARSTAVVQDREAQCCWETLYSALIPFTSISGVYVWDNWCPANGDAATRGQHHRYHCFNINREWDVCNMYHNYELQNDQIRPTIDLPWGSKGVAKTDDGRWQDREWRRMVNREDCLPLPEVFPDEPSDCWLTLLDQWRLPNCVDGHTYGEIEKAMGERWTELYVKGGIVPRYPGRSREERFS